MSSNLDHVVSTLATGDTVIATFVSVTHGHWSVEGKVKRTESGPHEIVKVGGVIVAMTPFANPTKGLELVTHLNSIAIVRRAAKPFFSNRPVDRKPKRGDIAETLYGELYYFDGRYFVRVASKRDERFTANDITANWGMVRLTSEAAAPFSEAVA